MIVEFRIYLLLAFIVAMGIVFKLEMLMNICPSMRHTIQTFKERSPGPLLNNGSTSPHPILYKDQRINTTIYEEKSSRPTLNNTRNSFATTPSSEQSHGSSLRMSDQTNKNKFSKKERIKSVMKERARGTGYEQESCDIETALLFLKSNINTSVETYVDPFEGMPSIGGKDWSFNSTVPCLHMNSTNFPLHSVGKGRAHLIPRCTKDDISLIKNANSNRSFPVFEFPDKCLKKIIDKFCSKKFVVPNILHYIWFGKQDFEFMYFVAIYSAYKNQNPCFIFVYYDNVPKGVWWDVLLLSVTNIVQVRMDPPSEIHGKKILFVQHKADIVRLHILKEYGGIYSDTDQFVLRSLDNLRNNDCTMGMSSDGYFGSALILARRNSTFINKWIASYSSYNPNDWGGNSVVMATKLSKQYPASIHVHAHYCAFYPFYPRYGVLNGYNYKWSYSYAFHIYKPGQMEQLETMNFSSIRTLNSTEGAIFRFNLFDNKELCL